MAVPPRLLLARPASWEEEDGERPKREGPLATLARVSGCSSGARCPALEITMSRACRNFCASTSPR
jgi:hypothetical protein